MAKPLKKRILHWLRDGALPVAGVGFYRAWFATVRKNIVGWDEHVETALKKGPVIFAHLHGDDLALICPFGYTGFTIMVSKSKDGELLAKVLTALGFKTVRGSTGKGGRQALEEMRGLIGQGQSMILTVDGPSGPRGVVKPGVITLAAWTGAPIFAAGVATRPKKVFEGTWHKTYLTYPLAKANYRFREPILVPADATPEELEAKRLAVEEELKYLHDWAESEL